MPVDLIRRPLGRTDKAHHMVTGPMKSQSVIASFKDPADFALAVANLLECGLLLEQLCYAALFQTLVRIPSAAPAALAATPFVRGVKAALERGRAGKAIGICGNAWTAPPLSNDRSEFPCLPCGTEAQLREGAIVLIVAPANFEQQRIAIRALLEHSTEHVEARDSRHGRLRPCPHASHAMG